MFVMIPSRTVPDLFCGIAAIEYCSQVSGVVGEPSVEHHFSVFCLQRQWEFLMEAVSFSSALVCGVQRCGIGASGGSTDWVQRDGVCCVYVNATLPQSWGSFLKLDSDVAWRGIYEQSL